MIHDNFLVCFLIPFTLPPSRFDLQFSLLTCIFEKNMVLNQDNTPWLTSCLLSSLVSKTIASCCKEMLHVVHFCETLV